MRKISVRLFSVAACLTGSAVNVFAQAYGDKMTTGAWAIWKWIAYSVGPVVMAIGIAVGVIEYKMGKENAVKHALEWFVIGAIIFSSKDLVYMLLGWFGGAQ